MKNRKFYYIALAPFVLGIIILFPIVMFILLVAKYIITEAIEYFTKS